MSTSAAGPEQLLRRGRALEVATLAWNVAGIAVLVLATVSARSVALVAFALIIAGIYTRVFRIEQPA